MRKERESGSARWFRGTRVANRCVRRCQAALAIQWLWSFRRLWVAATSSALLGLSLSSSGGVKGESVEFD
jgi:hypothetical protein